MEDRGVPEVKIFGTPFIIFVRIISKMRGFINRTDNLL